MYAVKSGKNVGSKLHAAIRKYGADAFQIEQIGVYATWADACVDEQKLIEKYDSYANGYNATKGGEGTHGYYPTAHTLALRSDALKGIPRSEEWKRKIGDGNRGRKFPPVTDEARSKMSAFQKGRVKSELHRDKIRAGVMRNWEIRRARALQSLEA